MWFLIGHLLKLLSNLLGLAAINQLCESRKFYFAYMLPSLACKLPRLAFSFCR